jgi:hypothetical protein
MLAGPGAKGNLPAAVKDIPVGKKADVLFFLHTFHRTKDWKAPQDDKKKDPPPVLFKYVVHYADGKTVDVPVRYGRGAGHWLSEQPQGLPEAAVAWAAAPPKDPKQQAAVYQMTWANPRPDQPIASIDVLSGEGYGVPVILAITGGTSRD